MARALRRQGRTLAGEASATDALLVSQNLIFDVAYGVGTTQRRNTSVNEELADRIRKELQRNALDHCYIRAAELDKICPDRDAREFRLCQLAAENGFVLAWYHETIGAIFTEPTRAAAPIQRVRAERPDSRPSRQPPNTI